MPYKLSLLFINASLKHSKSILKIHLTTRECYLHCAKLMCPGRPQLGQTNHWHLDEEMWPDAHARQALLMSQAGPSLFISDRSTYLLWQLQVPLWRRKEGASQQHMVTVACNGMHAWGWTAMTSLRNQWFIPPRCLSVFSTRFVTSRVNCQSDHSWSLRVQCTLTWKRCSNTLSLYPVPNLKVILKTLRNLFVFK